MCASYHVFTTLTVYLYMQNALKAEESLSEALREYVQVPLSPQHIITHNSELSYSCR
jgi:hypothetical protein